MPEAPATSAVNAFELAMMMCLHMAGLGVERGDHPIGGHLPGDAPAPVGAVGTLDRLDVLAGDYANMATASAPRGPNCCPGTCASTRLASPTSASTSSSRACLSFQAIAGLPGSV